MKPHLPKPEDGQATTSAVEVAAPKRGVDPLSVAHRRRLLGALNRAAQAGDVNAAAALVELSLGAQRDRAIAALDRLKADDEGEVA